MQPSYAPPQPQRNQYQTPPNNQAPQPHGHYREFSPMELDHPHEAAPRYHQQRQRVSFEKYFEGYNRLIKNDFIRCGKVQVFVNNVPN